MPKIQNQSFFPDFCLETDKGLIIPGDSANSSIQFKSSKEWMASSTKNRSSKADLLFLNILGGGIVKRGNL